MSASIPSKKIMDANVRKKQLYISTGMVSICRSTKKAFLLGASGGKKCIQVRAPRAEDLTLESLKARGQPVYRTGGGK